VYKGAGLGTFESLPPAPLLPAPPAHCRWGRIVSGAIIRESRASARKQWLCLSWRFSSSRAGAGLEFLWHDVIELDQLMQGIGLGFCATILEFHAVGGCDARRFGQSGPSMLARAIAGCGLSAGA
jgi:hypothetical protein